MVRSLGARRLHVFADGPYDLWMFATIAGPYPLIEDPAEGVLEATLADQLEAGLGMVGDGRVRTLAVDSDVAAAVRAWEAARDVVTRLMGAEAPPVKACLVGPLSTPGDPDAAGARLHSAGLALHAAGARVVQVDEPWAATGEATTDAGRERARGAWARLLDGVTGHVTLGLPGGGATAVGAEALIAVPFGSVLVDLVTGPDDWRPVARLPGERGVILGVADLRRARPDTKEVILWAARYAASMHGRGLARVGLAPSAGLERLPRDVARTRLAALADVAALATLPPDELVKHVDARSIDARSAALGRWEPRQRPRRGSPDG